MVLGATYMLYLYRRVIFGELTKDHLKDILDLDRREIAIFAPLVVIVVWLGIYPAFFINVMDASVVNLVKNYNAALAAVADNAITTASK